MLQGLLNRIGKFLRGTKNLESSTAQVLSREQSDLQELGVLAASIEHDIRNPLMVIQSEIALLRQKRYTDALVMSHLSYIEEQMERIFAVTQMIPFLRGRDDFYQQLMEKISVGDSIRRTVKAVKGETRGAEIYFKYRENKVVYVKAHRMMLERAMINVFKNALEAIREAKRQVGVIEVKLRIDPESEMVKIDIVDNGCGIPEENIPKLVTLFSTKSNKKANSGIGLYITIRILKLHQGQMRITSKAGEGTTVSLFLPKWKAQTESAPIQGDS